MLQGDIAQLLLHWLRVHYEMTILFSPPMLWEDCKFVPLSSTKVHKHTTSLPQTTILLLIFLYLT
jgi:hypothetical protein